MTDGFRDATSPEDRNIAIFVDVEIALNADGPAKFTGRTLV